jgi:hypothetical protein
MPNSTTITTSQYYTINYEMNAVTCQACGEYSVKVENILQPSEATHQPTALPTIALFLS